MVVACATRVPRVGDRRDGRSPESRVTVGRASMVTASPSGGIGRCVVGRAGSRGAARHAAPAVPALQLDATRQWALTLLTAQVANDDVMRTARARGRLLRMASTAVPDTFPEGH